MQFQGDQVELQIEIFTEFYGLFIGEVAYFCGTLGRFQRQWKGVGFSSSEGFSEAVGLNSLQNPFVCRLTLFHLHKKTFPSNLAVVMHSSNSGPSLWLHYKLIFALAFQSIGKSILSKGCSAGNSRAYWWGLSGDYGAQAQAAAEPLSPALCAPCILPGDFPRALIAPSWPPHGRPLHSWEASVAMEHHQHHYGTKVQSRALQLTPGGH